MVIQTFQNYFSYPSYISTSIIQEIPTNFPMISFCNIKSINYSNPKTLDYIQTNYESLYIPISLAVSPFDWLISQQYVLRQFINNDKNLKISDLKDLGYQIEDMLVSCYFNYKPCYASNFTYFYNPLYGNCYKFNANIDSVMQVSLPGLLYGLQLELFVGKPVDVFNEFHDGIVLSITNQTGEAFYQGDTIKAATEIETDFIVNRNFIKKLTSPWGE